MIVKNLSKSQLRKRTNDPMLELKRICRQWSNARNNCSAMIVSGDSEPKLLGKSYHYTNKRGQRIHYPGAYRRAWGKPIYNPSTIRVEVGIEWLASGKCTWENLRRTRLEILK